jgi:hypothetical protein
MSRPLFHQAVKDSENWVLAILGVLGTLFFIQTFHYRFSAAFFPRIVNSVMAALCLYRLGKNLWGLSTRPAVTEQSPEAIKGLRWHWSLLITALYFGVIYLIGFIWSTGLFLLVFPLAAGYKRWTIVIVVAVFTAVLTEVSFSLFLQIPLPEGLIFTLINR